MSSGRQFPWGVAAVAIVAAGLWLAPQTAERLIYERVALARGEWWRLWSGHLVHLSVSHLLWNLAVWLVAGIWLERVAPVRWRWFLLLAPPVVSAALYWGEPELARYGGLSGLAVGAVVLLALDRIEAGEARSIWLGVLALVAGKLAGEFGLERAIFARLPGEVRPVPPAHLSGAVAAGAIFLAHWGKKKLRQRTPGSIPSGQWDSSTASRIANPSPSLPPANRPASPRPPPAA